jgi:hypothetical protein
MTGGKVALVIVGSIVALIALALLASGAVLLWVDQTRRDEQGYFTTSARPFETVTYALVARDLDVGTDAPSWLFESGRFGTLRLSGESAGTGQELFLGIGPAAAVDRYLGATEYDEVTDVDYDPFRVEYRRHPGEAPPSPPTEQNFWVTSTQGGGRQAISWEVESGRWSIVAMNVDASRGVTAQISAGAKVSFIRWVAIGLLIAGAVGLVIAAFLIYFGVRPRPFEPYPPYHPGAPPPPAPPPPPAGY